jgi:hypothetical protein
MKERENGEFLIELRSIMKSFREESKMSNRQPSITSTGSTTDESTGHLTICRRSKSKITNATPTSQKSHRFRNDLVSMIHVANHLHVIRVVQEGNGYTPTHAALVYFLRFWIFCPKAIFESTLLENSPGILPLRTMFRFYFDSEAHS